MLFRLAKNDGALKRQALQVSQFFGGQSKKALGKHSRTKQVSPAT